MNKVFLELPLMSESVPDARVKIHDYSFSQYFIAAEIERIWEISEYLTYKFFIY